MDLNKRGREEGYYWVKYKNEYLIAKWLCNAQRCVWVIGGNINPDNEKYIEHINENRIKKPEELPD